MTYKVSDILVIVEDLIALKQAVDGPIDLADIEHLKRLGQVLPCFLTAPTESTMSATSADDRGKVALG